MSSINYKEALKSVLSEVCDAKLEQAVKDIMGNRTFLAKNDFRRVLERYLELLREELGI